MAGFDPSTEALRKLDLFEVILLDDLGYVQQSPDEAEVLFTLLAERYERRSVMVTSNLVFSQWDRIFREPDGHGRGDRPPGAPRRGARVRRAELSNGPVAPNVAAIATARASRPAAGAAVAAASPTCELLSVSGPEAITASTETFTAHIFLQALGQVISYPVMTAMPAASVMLAGTGADDDPSSRTRRTHSSSRSSHQPLPSEAARPATALRERPQSLDCRCYTGSVG